MSNTTSNNARIAKNTMLLYIRMVFTLCVSLYTSRVVLNALGVEDFGIYNVVGGVISMFSFICSAMSATSQRYLSYEIGRNNISQLGIVFNCTIQVHLILSLVVLLLGETLGLWFVVTQLVIPEDRFFAAVFVYHISIATAIVSFMSVPFNADIVAHEKMSAFAYISILEVSLKLLVALLITIAPIDKLIFYASALLISQLLIIICYILYARKYFSETHSRFIVDLPLLKKMFSFAGWSFIGNFAGMLYSQGINMLLNIFFGPIVNAARGIAIQIQGALQQFVGNFQMAINPQITKNFASNNLEQMHSLMFRSARFSFCLLFIPALPVLLELEYILHIWLGQVPVYTSLFARIMICISLTYTMANPCLIANQATGHVKKYQIWVTTLILMILPISYFALKLGAPAYSVFVVQLLLELVAMIPRMLILRKDLKLPIRSYFSNMYTPIIGVVFVSIIIPYITHKLLPYGFSRFLAVSVVSILSTIFSTLYIAMKANERHFIYTKLRTLITK